MALNDSQLYGAVSGTAALLLLVFICIGSFSGPYVALIKGCGCVLTLSLVFAFLAYAAACIDEVPAVADPRLVSLTGSTV
jgi:hypothetical protein